MLGEEPALALPDEGAVVGRAARVMRHRTKGSPGLPFVAFPLLLAVLVLGAACADVSGQATQQDIAQLRQDLNALTLAVHRGRGDTETVLGQLERRTREQAGESAKQLADLSARVDALAAEVARVSARIDEVSQRLESQGRQAPRGGASQPQPAQPSAGGPSAQESYQAAYQDLSKSLYPLAVSGFREFLRRFPDSPLADSAQYSIGEAYFGMAHAAGAGQADKAKEALEQAVKEFRKVVVNYPRGGKIPTALYKEALALAELKQTALARERLQYLLDHFPQSEEAPLAKERLAALKQ